MSLTLLSLGLQLRELRQKAKMTQTELARQSGVSREWLNSVENGKTKVEFGMVLDMLSTLGYVLDVKKTEKLNGSYSALKEFEQKQPGNA